uniref:Creatinase N-terminal domain-containing protein n=1 Tax=Brassica oleracea TaxID=3712 RepID=A0A3P6FT89_BRAOL|nr:unnamed protein product [Brassica oleracea]
MSPVVVHPLEFAGRSAFDKLEELRSKLKQESARGYVIAALDEVAWLYLLSRCSCSAFLYVDKKKVSTEASDYFKGLGVEVREYTDVISDL